VTRCCHRRGHPERAVIPSGAPEARGCPRSGQMRNRGCHSERSGRKAAQSWNRRAPGRGPSRDDRDPSTARALRVRSARNDTVGIYAERVFTSPPRSAQDDLGSDHPIPVDPVAVRPAEHLVGLAAIRSTRARRSFSYVANAAEPSGTSRRHRASSTALSPASDAPCPELDDDACAASPTRTIRPRRHRGKGAPERSHQRPARAGGRHAPARSPDVWFVLGAMAILRASSSACGSLPLGRARRRPPLGSRFRERPATHLAPVDLTQGVSRAHFDRFTEAAGSTAWRCPDASVTRSAASTVELR
jgi:hypothetical protein